MKNDASPAGPAVAPAATIDAASSWIAKAAPPNSNEYFALLFCAKEKQAVLGALLAMHHEVTASARGHADAGVAELKLAWWGEEAAFLSKGRPRHPVTSALHAATLPREPLRASFSAMLDSARQDLTRTGYENESRWLDYCGRSGGALQTLLALAQSPGSAGTLSEYARQLGTGLRIVEILANLRADAHAGRVFLPLDMLAAADTGLAQLQGRARPAQLLDVMVHCAAHARRCIVAASAALPDEQRARQRYGAVIAALTMRALAVLEKDGFPPDAGLAGVNPLGKLWIAWRSARATLAGRMPRL